MPEKEKLIYQIALGMLDGIGPVKAKKLVAHLGGVEAIFSEKPEHLRKLGKMGLLLEMNLKDSSLLKKAQKEVEYIHKEGINPLFYLDGDYPSKLKNCEDGPLMLYAKGNVDFKNQRIISIVGTRRATERGKLLCEKFIEDISPFRPLILSGLAYGIDYWAHKKAFELGLQTIAVMGHGMNHFYPAAHRDFGDKIQENGGILSEFNHDVFPDPKNFPKRNRIVAGISDSTVVIESSERGGSLITARLANSYNRDVFAFPGRPDDKYSRGCNRLIRQNQAHLIEGADDFLELMSWNSKSKTLFSRSEINSDTNSNQGNLFFDRQPEEIQILDILKNKGKVGIDELSVKCGLPVNRTSAILLNLEFAGLVKSMPGKHFSLN